MVLKNCDLDKLKERVKEKKFVIWGAGKTLTTFLEIVDDKNFVKSISYIIDSGNVSNYMFGNTVIHVSKPSKLKEEKNVIILITSRNYYLEIYDELRKMSLPDTVDCYIWDLIEIMQPDTLLEKGRIALQTRGELQIPKVIHTFWFSGDPLPDEYEKCLDSWRKYCPDYEIKIWNQQTYDCTKNKFVRDAIKARKWAFAADVARIDVLYDYGGIYMDLDIEIYRPLDDMLYHKGVFCHSGNYIDMPVFSSARDNSILKELKKIYENLEFSTDETIQKTVFIQPQMVTPIFKKKGVPLEEGVHEVDGNLFIPKDMFLPRYWFDWSGKSKCGEAGYGIHHCNAGWIGGDFKEERERRTKRVIELWEELYG